MKTLLAVLTLSFGAAARQSAQTDTVFTRDAPARLSVFSDPEGAEVYLDGKLYGTTPILKKEIPPGKHELRMFSSSAVSWQATMKSDSVIAVAGQETNLSYELSSLVSLNTIPPGAKVLENEVPIGATPLFVNSRPFGILTIEKEGFEKITTNVRDLTTGDRLIRLKPRDSRANGISSGIVMGNSNGGKSTQWLTIASAATMILSGVLAAYLKDQANHEFDSYVQTNDPLYLTSTNRLDRQSASAFIVTQISFGVLAFLLLSD